jgi:molybdopterin-guanine dinucleotide biosynthesis protein MobB
MPTNSPQYETSLAGGPVGSSRPTPPAVGFVGWSGSGKTTLIEHVIAGLTARGYRVGALKHDAHRFTIDVPGKDSYRFTAAGAEATLIVAADKLALLQRHTVEPSPEVLIATYFSDMDIIVVEGYKRSSLAKIEVYRPTLGRGLIATTEGHLANLIAVASDEALSGASLPDAESLPANLPILDLNDPTSVVDFLVRKFLSAGDDP